MKLEKSRVMGNAEREFDAKRELLKQHVDAVC